MRLSLSIFLMLTLMMLSSAALAQSEPQDERPTQQVDEKPWRKKTDKDGEKTRQKSVRATQKTYASMARALLGDPHWSERFWRLLEDETPKIAIHPFKAEDLPIPLPEAQAYVEGLSTALVAQSKGRYAIVGRQELGAVVDEIHQIGTRTESVNPLGELMDRARSDLLAVGHLALQKDWVVLSYKLVETESGRIVSTAQGRFKRSQGEVAANVTGLSLKGAAVQAARKLLRDASKLDYVMVQGLRYQTSGVHTAFGRYFMEMLSDEFRKVAASGPRNINNLSLSDFVVEEEQFRGLKLAKSQTLEENQLGSDAGRYLIKGTYWVLADHIEIRLTLFQTGGASVSWRGRVLRSEIPEDLTLVPPPAPIEEADSRPLGPIDLYLSSNKGENPQYKVGEEMTLMVRAGEEAHLACYYVQADGAIFRIFPNRFMTADKLSGGFVQHIPAAGMPFAFEFAPPRGVEAVKCYATDRDVSSRIIPQTVKAAFEPLPQKNERELTKLYRSLSDVTLSEASLIVTVH
ncbi:DUF4384 domain-containing protein [Terasakiella pusilla]|uniref:DUF4384 domain-containing protein n=1 Tax=Terasakiella pusilla TaxID=64973 RepID=UPI003AA89388